jgi:GTP cyclohydrolase I
MDRARGDEVSYEVDGLYVSMPLPDIDSDYLEDVQNRRDHRGVAIDYVGVSDLDYPIVVLDRAEQRQQTVANLTLSVGLPHHSKGTHMSRFIEVLEVHRGEVTIRTIPTILREIKERLDADSARIEVSFPYFLERQAPSSGVKALMDYQCSFIGEVNGTSEEFVLGVKVPVTTLCPCSKKISDYGAHNQRGYITIEVKSASSDSDPEIIWIEELIEVAEKSASAPVYALLKREDERHVTMQAYDNPVFVEDMVRNVAVQLQKDLRVIWFRARAENHESIHNHNAFAQVSWCRKSGDC